MFDHILSSEQISFSNGRVRQWKAGLQAGIRFSPPLPQLLGLSGTFLHSWYLRWPGTFMGRWVLDSDAVFDAQYLPKETLPKNIRREE